MFKTNPLILCDPCDFIAFSSDSFKNTASILLKNVVKENVAFKLKSNAPDSYKVTPTKGIISRGQSVQLKITAKQPIDSNNHSFMIISQVVNSVSENFEKAWDQYAPTHKIKLKVGSKYSSTALLPNQSQLKDLIEQKNELKKELDEAVKELKDSRISTLKSHINMDREYGYLHAIISLLAGIIVAIVFPYYFL
jgi:MSP (Major sperm protein) domain